MSVLLFTSDSNLFFSFQANGLFDSHLFFSFGLFGPSSFGPFRSAPFKRSRRLKKKSNGILTQALRLVDLATTDISALFDAQEDLSKLKLEELQTMAKDAGVDKNKVKGAMKADDPEAALIALLPPKIVSLEQAVADGEKDASAKAVVA